MKCKDCGNELTADWSNDLWCEHCVPVDTNVDTCECGGRIDWFCYPEECEYGSTPISEYRCVKCGKNETEIDTERDPGLH